MGPTGFQPFNSRGEITVYRRYLPHWRQKGATYFVTCHLADSLPDKALREMREMRREHELRCGAGAISPEETEAQSIEVQRRLEAWLDAGHGSCALQDHRVADLSVSALQHYDKRQYRLFAYVVMPNHWHLAIKPLENESLESIMQGRKSLVAKEANRLLESSGQFWHQESYDRIVRDAGHLFRVIRYIERNPSKAGLSEGQYCLGLCTEWRDWYEPLAGGECKFSTW